MEQIIRESEPDGIFLTTGTEAYRCQSLEVAMAIQVAMKALYGKHLSLELSRREPRD